jgi:adenine-specific DNA-methyltransferase
MKYMGSKMSMLSNGLGSLLTAKSAGHERFVDLMTGSGAVAWFVAERTTLPVVAIDLQEYATILARSVVGRTQVLDAERLVQTWVDAAEASFLRESPSPSWSSASLVSKSTIRLARTSDFSASGPIAAAYAGHYFSPDQANALDALLHHLPSGALSRVTCQAALIVGASRFIGAPGHTAQPLRPTPGALPYLQKLWTIDPFEKIRDALREIAPRHARTRGAVRVQDAQDAAARLMPRDLVFLDPPYSAVHYSRFYHVYETLARGHCGPVTGAGRYPPQEERPSSDFSIKTRATQSLRDLLATIAKRGCTVVITFPESECSNGVSGAAVIEIAKEHFSAVDVKRIPGRFSTLGGNGVNREARHSTTELAVTAR